jgi:hypothetical protein
VAWEWQSTSAWLKNEHVSTLSMAAKLGLVQRRYKEVDDHKAKGV